VTDALVNEFPSVAATLAFHTIVVTWVNAAAIADELAGVKMWRNRCNRQLVDLNRNFPTGGKPRDTDCPNTDGAPIQPEVQGVMDLVTKFKLDWIVSTHAISNPKAPSRRPELNPGVAGPRHGQHPRERFGSTGNNRILAFRLQSGYRR
jgi:hypothetical protein